MGTYASNGREKSTPAQEAQLARLDSTLDSVNLCIWSDDNKQGTFMICGVCLCKLTPIYVLNEAIS